MGFPSNSVAGIGPANFALVGGYGGYSGPLPLPMTLTLTLPAGIHAGDLLVAFIQANPVGRSAPGGPPTHPVTTPAGWSLYVDVNFSWVTDVFFRVADGTEGATQDFVYAAPGPSQGGFQMQGAIVSVRGQMFVPMLHTSRAATQLTSTPSMNGPTTTIADAIMLAMFSPVDPAAIVPGDLTGCTSLIKTQSSAPPIVGTFALWSRNFLGPGYSGVFDSETGWGSGLTIAEVVVAIVPGPNQIPVPPPVPPPVVIPGELIGLTYDPPEVEDGQDVYAWHRHPLGASAANDTSVRSIATIPAPDGTRDELWLLVQRTINGRVVTYVEYMEKAFDSGDAQASACMMDCSVQYAGAPATVLFPLNHLEGETVRVLVDGAAHPDRVVTNGQITLEAPASVAQIGLATKYDVVTLRVEAGSQTGTAQAKLKRITKLNGIRLLNSLSAARIGEFDTDLGDPLEYRDTDNPMDSPPALFTGDKVNLSMEGDWTRNGRIQVTGDDALPITIVALFPELSTTDG